MEVATWLSHLSRLLLSVLGLVLSLHAVQTLTNHLFEGETRRS